MLDLIWKFRASYVPETVEVVPPDYDLDSSDDIPDDEGDAQAQNKRPKGNDDSPA